jgi:hypothetical protein
VAPCEHLWRLSGMKVSDDDPTVATIFQRCQFCGAVETFQVAGRSKVYATMTQALLATNRTKGVPR